MSQIIQKPDIQYKVIIVGDSGVGKSCFLLQFTEGIFKTDHNVTLGAEYGSKVMDIDSKKIKLQIWDTVIYIQAGEESFRSITRTFYRNSHGVILMYNIRRLESFNHIPTWLEEARQNTDPDVSIFLVGNKCDKADSKRTVTTEQADNFAKANHLAGFIEVSAKTALNVSE